MNSSKAIGIILILFGLWIGYVGMNKVSANTHQINILGAKIDADNENGKSQGYLYLGLAAVLFAGGIYLTGKKSR